MKRSAIVGAVLTVGTVLGVLAPVAGSTAAWADGPRYVTSTMTFDFVFPAGAICDFDFHNVVTVTDRTAIFPDKMIDHSVTLATDTNLVSCAGVLHGRCGHGVLDVQGRPGSAPGLSRDPLPGPEAVIADTGQFGLPPSQRRRRAGQGA